MKSSIQYSKLMDQRSDERDNMELTNDLRRVACDTYRGRFTITTTDALFASIWTSEDMPVNSIWDVDFCILAESTDGNSAAYRRVIRYKRGAGVPTVLTIATTVADYEDVAAWNIATSAVGNGVQFYVAGDAGRTVDWVITVEIREAA